MKKTIVQQVVYDDLDIAEKDAKTDATQTRTLGVGGKWVELDLTDEHAAEFDALVDRYMKAGTRHVPDKPGSPRRNQQGGGPGSRGPARRRREQIAAWAIERSLPVTELKKIPGDYYIPVATQAAWDAHLAGREVSA